MLLSSKLEQMSDCMSDDSSVKCDDVGALRISSISRDARGNAYNKINENAKSTLNSQNNKLLKTKLKFIERSKYERDAMSPRERGNYSRIVKIYVSQWRAFCKKMWCGNETSAHLETKDDALEHRVQFKVEKYVCFKSFVNEFFTSDYWNKNYVRILHKMSYSTIVFASFLGFTALVVMFAFIILITSKYCERCITTGNYELVHDVTFNIAFSMSWVTISTVGYGHLLPVSGERNLDCLSMEFIAFLESFVGVFYAGLCGAVFYSRLTKAWDKAEVSFSHVMCLRRDADADGCPVLEIRIVNNLANYGDGEIIDANVNCLVSKGWWSANEDEEVKFKRRISLADCKQSSVVNLKRQQTSVFHSRSSFNSIKSNLKLMNETSNPENVSITQPNMPYFERLWIVRHKLDSNSPLLRQDIKKLIFANGGTWPDTFNSKTEIRDCFVPFNDIIVTLNGTSVETGNNVFAKSSYSLSSIVEGWEFKEMIYEDKIEGRMKLDYELISDIIEENTTSMVNEIDF